MDVSPMNQAQDERIVETPKIDETTQLEINGDEEGYAMEEDVVDDEE